MRYTVFQFKLSRAARDAVNTVGWDDAKKQFPEVAIQRDVSFSGGSEYFSAWMSEYYAPVCNIDAATLNGVFQIGNMGPEESIERLAPMHSVSVGDVIRDNDMGTYFMVDCEGFTQLLSFIEEVTILGQIHNTGVAV